MERQAVLPRQTPTTAHVGITSAQVALAFLRIILGVLFVWVYFENRGKGLYMPGGYAGLIGGYIRDSTAPTAWKGVMQFAADHANIAAPLQGATELSFGILLILGLLTRPVALAAFAFLTSLWVSELGTAWIWELLIPMTVALSLAIGGAGRALGVDGPLHARSHEAAGRGNLLARLVHVLT